MAGIKEDVGLFMSIYQFDFSKRLRLSKTGEWFHDDIQFTHKRLTSLFHRSIEWDDKEQGYFIRIGQQRAKFECEDTAYFVTELFDISTPWRIKLLDDSEEVLNPASISVGNEGQFYCSVKGGHRARFGRASHQALLAHAVGNNTLVIDGIRIELNSA